MTTFKETDMHNPTDAERTAAEEAAHAENDQRNAARVVELRGEIREMSSMLNRPTVFGAFRTALDQAMREALAELLLFKTQINVVEVALAVSPDGSNVYVEGVNCINCDPTYDPHYRTGVPCRAWRAHAARTVSNWRSTHPYNRDSYRVVEVIVSAEGELDDQVARARAVVSLSAR
ncbi:MAG: hypothetical protein ABIQ18_39700 [Umezawaea sp.]